MLRFLQICCYNAADGLLSHSERPASLPNADFQSSACIRTQRFKGAPVIVPGQLAKRYFVNP
jgi:hypothetical protein